MKKHLLLIAILASFTVHSQTINADLYAGVSSYQGDLNGSFSLQNAHFAGGLGLSFNATRHFVVRTAFTMSKLSGADAGNSGSANADFRNLDFETSLKEVQLGIEYTLFDMQEKSFSPYLFGGAAMMWFNPYTRDIANNKVYLKPLGTEGQGIPEYPEKKEYDLTQFAIPFGGGIKLALSDNLQIGLELGFRKLFTDYLDDVSGTYADSSLLSNFRGSLAVELAYRGDEHGGPGYPGEGAQRGNPKNKDWYTITAVRLRYLLNNQNEGSGNTGGRRSKVGCPSNVF